MIGDTIYKERVKIGMTQENLSDYLNLTKSTISKWENNQAKPDIDYLIQLAKLFDMTLDDLVGFQSLLSSDERKQLVKNLKEQREFLSDDDFFEKIDHLTKQHINDSKTVLMLIQLLLNTPSLDMKDWSLRLINRIISKATLASDLQAALTLKTTLLFQKQAYDEIISLYNDRPYKLGEELLLANSYVAKGDIPMAKQVLQVEIFQQILLLCEYLASLSTYESNNQQESIICRLEQLITIFNINQLHPNTAIKCYYTMALYHMADNSDKSLVLLGKLLAALTNLLQQFELHGDDFFYAISEWLADLPMGIQPPASQKDVINQIEAIFMSPVFQSLNSTDTFQNYLVYLADLKKEYTK